MVRLLLASSPSYYVHNLLSTSCVGLTLWLRNHLLLFEARGLKKKKLLLILAHPSLILTCCQTLQFLTAWWLCNCIHWGFNVRFPKYCELIFFSYVNVSLEFFFCKLSQQLCFYLSISLFTFSLLIHKMSLYVTDTVLCQLDAFFSFPLSLWCLLKYRES